jgi:predicted adenine nucleotide alpha hydrolase (AANH) superfamily ATPase
MTLKLDYQKQLDSILSTIKNKPTLLLHACCAPCSSYVIEYLSSYFDITIYYYNPNIHPIEEYNRRLTELQNFITKFPPAIKNNISLIIPPYDPEDYFIATNARNEKFLQTEPERGERCRRCYLLRMKKAYEFALANSFNFFTTTLSISPYKDSKMINEIGFNLVQENNISSSTLHYLPADFKKRNGFLRSLQLSKEYGLYRQDYCGCIYSQQKR